ncbi:fused signal recognition particle receptor [Saccharopolyspora antimicrobica]|uniref:Signal recognition particle receptor FtsY n=1 Tax=Saccharopolyspora antimicrobica TaxID=455193 RepID=A0A1I4T4L3_9PSEU|nr:signal recognition particle-docking protein FtsY [Saccharopolyspora antimicrobica]RKT85875.1 signal recognition particle-docking protein FtsY [Saccharopolyspora antimicrobica]SFM71490.1 fused signal recognition particle receptor [Saccharopolyspora antimicrobica]
MTTSTVILIIVAVVLVLAIAVIAGVVLNRRRRISLSEQDDSTAPTEPVKGGSYRADGGISLSSGGTTTAAPPEHPAGERTEVEGQPGVGDDAAVPRDTERRGIVDVELPDGGGTTTAEPPAPEKPSAPEAAEKPSAPEAPEKPEAPVEPEVPAQERVEPVPEPIPAEPEAVEEIEEIEPTAGRLERLRGRLSRSRSTFGQGLLGLLGAGDLDEDSWEEIEDTLLLADLGAATTTEITERLRTEIASRGVRTPEQARALLREVLVDALGPDMERAVRALPHGDPADGGKPAVVLVVGVNGTGKTTTTGKLARVLVADGRTVLLGAADTFRAAAVEQLATWGSRVGAEVVRGKEGADPASVAFEAVSRGSDTAVDAVLVDTAGRLHTKTGLMDELGKVKRVVEKKAQVDEVLLVLDATTGQNGLIQARVFSEVVDVTGIVLTKLDGTAKGGIVFQVQRELGVPVKLVGLGEGPDDLAPFQPEAFVDALLD